MAEAKLFGIYRCNVCGNMVEMIKVGKGQLVCCGEQMELLEEQEKEMGFEKHIPIVEKTEKGFKVKVGEIAHPMEESHYIEWIELLVDDKIYRKYLKISDIPEAEFCLSGKNIKARAYCNIHSLWKSI
jgi:superoxide reductase